MSEMAADKTCTSCSNCVAAPLKSCVCGGARYCDTGCQKSDWIEKRKQSTAPGKGVQVLVRYLRPFILSNSRLWHP